MKHEPRKVIRVIKAFKTENADYPLDEICGVRASLAKQFVRDGLAEIINLDELEEEEDEAAEADVKPPSGPAWDHSDLGTFHFDDTGWSRRVELREFEKFKYGARHRPKSPPTYPLLIRADSPKQTPTPAQAGLAKSIVTHQAVLVPKLVDALWADFTGDGPESGMYWHGDLDQVAEGMMDFNEQDLKPPAAPAICSSS